MRGRPTIRSAFPRRPSPVDRDSQEEPLLGGITHAAAVRIGDTVLRPTGAWTPAVHAVLAHLESRGVPAPRASAIDERRRESLGRSIRLLHNGMADFTPDPVWLRNAPGAGSPLVGRLARHQPRCLTHAAGVDDAGALRRIRAFVRGQVADNFPADTIAGGRRALRHRGRDDQIRLCARTPRSSAPPRRWPRRHLDCRRAAHRAQAAWEAAPS